jgi:hypothetical protein
VHYEYTAFETTGLTSGNIEQEILTNLLPEFYKFPVKDASYLTVIALEGEFAVRINFFDEILTSRRPISNEDSLMEIYLDS